MAFASEADDETLRSIIDAIPGHVFILDRDAGGQIIRWYGIRTEIDARKRAEETIRENEQELRTTIETIPAYVWTNLPDGTIDFISQTWLDYIGLTRDEYLGWRWTENVHPDDVDA